MRKLILTILTFCLIIPQTLAASSLRADAGADQSASPNQTITLTAANSFLAGSRESDLEYTWEIISRPQDYTGSLTAEGITFNFQPNSIGTYLIKLTLTNETADETSSDFVTITVKSFDQAFSDLPNSHWARPYFYHLYSAGILRGYGDGTLKPDTTITRAEFLALCFRALSSTTGRDLETTSTDIYFADVKPSNWYYKTVLTAAAYEIVEGYADRTFKPEQNVSRAEAIKIALSFTDTPVEFNTATYSQLSNLNATDWQTRYMLTGYRLGLLGTDKNTYLHPSTKLTRADAAALIDRIFLNPEQNSDQVVTNKTLNPRDY